MSSLFSNPLPIEDGEDWPATTRTTFESAEDDVTGGIGVLAMLHPGHGLMFAFDTYGSDAVLDTDGARALIKHLAGIIEAATTD